MLCNVCECDKSVSEFYRSPRTKNGYQSRCKQCAATSYHKPHYKLHKERYIATARAQLQSTQELINATKTERGCSLCGESRYWCLAFHHIDGDLKEDAISNMRRNGNGAKLLAEIEKCVVVCHNCHADIHHRIRTD